jgi:UDP-N-acetylglucosamine--N-acetylmuramyl-(pentapeptide) pyrophosphoryl-undecaprenol N-acetylglucosamine transferase
MKTIVLTGGHLSPAIAMSEEFASRGWNVILFGRKYAFSESKETLSLESEMAKEIRVKFEHVEIDRFPQTFFSTFRYMYHFLKSTVQVAIKFQEIKPICVLSFGGYTCVPVVVSALLLRIPVFTHDQVMIPGRANRFFSLFSKRIFISWKESEKEFPFVTHKKIQYTGNPIRKSIRINAGLKQSEKKEFVLYITGGSTGSHAINTVISDCLDKLVKDFHVIHQSGDSYFHDFEMLVKRKNELSPSLNNKYTVTKYVLLGQLSRVLSSSDVVIARSGANTVSEVALLGIPAIFIPLPFSQYDEQDKLAQKLGKQGGAIIIKQDELTAKKLLSELYTIYHHYSEYYEHAQQYRQSEEITIHSEAHARIADSVELFDYHRRNFSS